MHTNRKTYKSAIQPLCTLRYAYQGKRATQSPCGDTPRHSCATSSPPFAGVCWMYVACMLLHVAVAVADATDSPVRLAFFPQLQQ